MPKFRYNGDHQEMFSYGYDFSNGATVNVPDTDTFVVGKLTNNSHFDNLDDSEIEPETLDDSDIDDILDKDMDIKEPVQYGVFKKKNDGTPYSVPKKVFETGMERWEVENYIKENYDNPDDYIIREK